MNRKVYWLKTWLLFGFAIFSQILLKITYSQTVPPLINYQGKLVSSNGLPVGTGDYELRFRIWDAPTGGNQVWGPQVFNGQSGPGFGPLVPAVQGWFNVMLGPVDTNSLSVANAFADQNRYIEIQIGSSPPVRPRQRMLSAPYAFNALTALNASFASRAAVAETAQTAASALMVVGAETLAPLTLYVSPSGSEQTDGLSLATAKRSIQAAINAVPRRILHPVEILVSPGIYREALVITDKQSVGRIRLVGTGASRGDTVLRGVDEGGINIGSHGLYVAGSKVSIENMTIADFPVSGVSGYAGADIEVGAAEFLNCERGLELQQFAFARLKGVSFKNPSGRRYLAIWAEDGAIVNMRTGSDGTKNSLINLSEGIKASRGANISGARDISITTFQDVSNPFIEEQGGRIF